MLQVAADPITRSPARLAEAGPWWDHNETTSTPQPAATVDMAVLEANSMPSTDNASTSSGHENS